MLFTSLQPSVRGNLSFDKANFRYPSRREYKVLRDFSFAVREGQKVALVGPSGCGKSTCIQLLLRFYNLNSGDVV